MMIKKLFEELERAERRTDEIDAAWENDYENEELETAWNEAYKTEHEIFDKVVTEIVAMTNGMIDRETARVMIISKREEIKALVKRIA